jgi:hypothetical protein
MIDSMLSIVERLALLEGRIATKDSKSSVEKKPVPALFQNLKKTSEDFIPQVNAVSFAEDHVEEDVLSKVKSSFADYLKNMENEIKQDRDLLDKKYQDLDLIKKELKDLTLQSKSKPKDLEEDPNQTPSTGEAPAGLIDPTYAESAPIKTISIEESGDPALGSGGGGYPLVEIHGDENDGFRIRCGSRELPTRFNTLDEAEMAVEMFAARRKAKREQDANADYLEEK